MKFNENMLNDYSQPLSKTEDEHCKNAIRMVSDALKSLGFTDDNKPLGVMYTDTYAYSAYLRSISGNRKIKLFIQGSYANNTNVRTQSDVDVAVIQEDIFQTEYRSKDDAYPQSSLDYGFITVPNPQKSFKDEVEECLKIKFGRDVERKNKSIKVHGNTYRKDADTVPCRRYRDYRLDYQKNKDNYVGGVVITSDKGEIIINYPEQHIKNGRTKNSNTHLYYKKMVRIMKKMRYIMEDCGNAFYADAAKGVSSFMLESLLWNIPDKWYIENCSEYRKVFAFQLMINYLKGNKQKFNVYKEANGIKYLCPNNEANVKLCQFIDRLCLFYEYE